MAGLMIPKLLIMQWVFTQPEAERVIATVPPDNLASRRVAERVGMRETGEVRRGSGVKETTGFSRVEFQFEPNQAGDLYF
jgi:RimJ/RimL family protein N-acetyltransferase